MDRYGFTRDDPRFTMELEDDYVEWLPDDQLPKARAMQYAQAWGMSWVDIMNMQYADFYEAAIVHKAVTFRRPWWTGAAGELAHAHEQSSHRRLAKPRR